ncbi:hypothetical protein F4X86_02590 [Candidatus Saccharibacteria bacterium]|nr:hypothetical protein [Candidatus Saccharibacteria bacterium]
MSDKERSILPDNESFDERFHAEGVKLDETNASGIRSQETDESTGHIRENALDAPVSQFDEKVVETPGNGQNALSTSKAGQGSAENKRSLVAELASHLGEQRSDFHKSKQTISYCRKRFRDARF